MTSFNQMRLTKAPWDRCVMDADGVRVGELRQAYFVEYRFVGDELGDTYVTWFVTKKAWQRFKSNGAYRQVVSGRIRCKR